MHLFTCELLQGLTSENFDQFESITVYIVEDCLMEVINILDSLLEILKIKKSICPIVAFDGPTLIDLDESSIYQRGWILLKPLTYGELYQQVGATIQETIVRE